MDSSQWKWKASSFVTDERGWKYIILPVPGPGFGNESPTFEARACSTRGTGLDGTSLANKHSANRHMDHGGPVYRNPACHHLRLTSDSRVKELQKTIMAVPMR